MKSIKPKIMKTPSTKKILIFSSILLVFLLAAKGNTLLQYAKMQVWDLITEQRIKMLHPLVRTPARAFINKAAELGIKLRITAALRTFAQQNDLYAQGRTTPGKIVTNAEAGESYHNYGLAIDVVPIVNGKADWNTDWYRIAAIGKSFGFSWGGDWVSFKDKPHFQMTFGNTIADLQYKTNNGVVDGDYVNLAA